MKTMKKAIALTFAILGICSSGLAAEGAAADKTHYGVIFQVDSDSEAVMKKTLNNIKNALDDPRIAGKLQVELIANSKGYAIYRKGNPFEKTLMELKERGVILSQCGNTLRELKVDPKTLYPFIHVVPSAMGELVIRQGQGWAYIHPTQ